MFVIICVDNTYGEEKEGDRLFCLDRSQESALSCYYVSICLKSVQDNGDRSGILSYVAKNIMMFSLGAKGQ